MELVPEQPKEQEIHCIPVEATTDVFQKAIERYLEEMKPDPLAKRQVQAWTLEWKSRIPSSATSVTAAGKESFSFEPTTHALRGMLDIQGEHVVVSIQAECYWNHVPSNTDEVSNDGSLYLSLSAQARFVTKAERSRRQPPPSDQPSDKKEAKLQEKIQGKLLQRLRDDNVLSKLLGTDLQLLAEASIKVTTKGKELEERVHISDEIAEAIRRAIYSSAESSLDIVEVLLFMPFLPTTMHRSSMSVTTPLADRAKLRLLEDAMFDACEKEGEDELIGDLDINDEAVPANEDDNNNERTSVYSKSRSSQNSRKKSKTSKI